MKILKIWKYTEPSFLDLNFFFADSSDSGNFLKINKSIKNIKKIELSSIK